MGTKMFMCYVAGSSRTSRIHSTQEQAEVEAKRLSKLPHNKGKKVCVLAGITEYQTNKEDSDTK